VLRQARQDGRRTAHPEGKAVTDEIIELLDGRARLLRVGPTGDRTCERELSLPALLAWLADRAVAAAGYQTPLVIPGARHVAVLGAKTVIVVEQAPRVQRVQWINAGDDPSLPEDAFVDRLLAFPYIIFILSYEDGEPDGYHQLYYRTRPLDRLDAPLLQANLLNVTQGRDSRAHWLCLGQNPAGDLPWPARMEQALQSFWGTPFNLDFEVPRGSGFTRLRTLDPRIASAKQWEAASRLDPLFPLTIPWPEAGLTLEEAVQESLASIRPPAFPTSLQGLADAMYRIPTEELPCSPSI
jgi:hypothetical protein